MGKLNAAMTEARLAYTATIRSSASFKLNSFDSLPSWDA
jgi:hypothetical protein